MPKKVKKIHGWIEEGSPLHEVMKLGKGAAKVGKFYYGHGKKMFKKAKKEKMSRELGIKYL